MPALQPFELILALLVSICAAGGILASTSIFIRRLQHPPETGLQDGAEKIAFLFDGQDLIDATPRAWELLNRCVYRISDWEKLMTITASRFPSFKDEIAALGETSEFHVEASATDSPGQIDVRRWDGLTRIEVRDEIAEAEGSSIDELSLSAMEDELGILRSLASQAPQLIWRLDQSGQITWANEAYLDLADQLAEGPSDGIPTWPPAHLFDRITGLGESEKEGAKRVSVDLNNGTAKHWFDVKSFGGESGSTHFASNANALVKAEEAQRNFVQTLTKTFAHLSIGLAIFDRKRELVLFNPALLDLTGLPVDFLATRPSLSATLDRMRELRMLPEPKNYTNWRDTITNIETAAADGTYSETWNLTNGQTYRVSGRPHPDGAVAFLFEDISADISLTRRFRSQIDLGQSVIDTLTDAVAVFSSSGTLTMSNKSFDTLWDIEDTDRIEEVTVIDVIRNWQDRANPTPLWGEIRDFLQLIGERSEWSDRFHMKDGRVMHCRIQPHANGNTICTFSQTTEELKKQTKPEVRELDEKLERAIG